MQQIAESIATSQLWIISHLETLLSSLLMHSKTNMFFTVSCACCKNSETQFKMKHNQKMKDFIGADCTMIIYREENNYSVSGKTAALL